MNPPHAPDPFGQQFAGWLIQMIQAEASDLHIVAGHPPVLRVHGAMHPIDTPPLDGADVEQLLTAVCPAELFQRFRAEKNVDFSLERPVCDQVRRFRANYFLSLGVLGACFRLFPAAIPDFHWAGFPDDLAQKLAHFRNGLVLVTGVAGSGKTTTLAMLIELLNRAGGYRIITIEEPVEYVFSRTPRTVITQREVGLDVDSFAAGLKYALRQDPNVILVGEIRDRDTAQMALSAAETGHLVFSTMHTRDAKGAISRFTDLFPQSVQPDIRAQLSMSLRSVIGQHLLPSERQAKRELALEIMFNSSPIAAAIRFAKLETIDTYILSGRSQGMVTLDDSIRNLLREGRVRRDVAERFVSDPSRLP